MFPELKQTYGNNHSYPIHTLCTLADMESFISADFVKINLWKFDHCDSSYSLPARNNAQT